MKERPIIFSAPMVRALLAGTKTQTRRIVKPQPAHSCWYEINGAGTHALHLGPPRDANEAFCFVPPTPTSRDHRLPCPYGVVGDRLWVKETIARVAKRVDADASSCDVAAYAADDHETVPIEWIWKRDKLAAIHCPRGLSRIDLEITSLRVERLLDITEDDARAEGVAPFFEMLPGIGRDQRLTTGELCRDAEHRASFAVLWDSLNADRASWKSNPFVWVIGFKCEVRQ